MHTAPSRVTRLRASARRARSHSLRRTSHETPSPAATARRTGPGKEGGFPERGCEARVRAEPRCPRRSGRLRNGRLSRVRAEPHCPRRSGRVRNGRAPVPGRAPRPEATTPRTSTSIATSTPVGLRESVDRPAVPQGTACRWCSLGPSVLASRYSTRAPCPHLTGRRRQAAARLPPRSRRLRSPPRSRRLDFPRRLRPRRSPGRTARRSV